MFSMTNGFDGYLVYILILAAVQAARQIYINMK